MPVETKGPSEPMAYVDWYLSYMQQNLNRDMKAEYVWDFSLRTKDLDGMHALAKALRKARYATQVQEVVMESTPVESGAGKGKSKGRMKWKSVEGPPLVMAFSLGKPNTTALKRRLLGILKLAKKHDATFSSVSSMDQEEFEMFFGPPKAMPLADALWRLLHYTDTGLKEGAKIEYTFCLVTEDVKACAAALKKAGFTKVARAPRDANWTISVSVPGVNDEKRLKAEYAAMRKAAKSCGAKLKGLDC